MSADLPDLVRALRDPDAYAHAPGEVELIQTHVSWVFLAGDRVYKVKKPVNLGFVDFSGVDRRRHFCEEEVRLNRRLSSTVHLGVTPVTREADGSFRMGGVGEPVDWAVAMRRLPENRMLDHRLREGCIDNADIASLVDLLASFHAGAATGPDVAPYGAPEAVLANVQENFTQLGPFAGTERARRLLDFLHERAYTFLAGHRELFERRVREGRIRDGHGDLHAGNVCMEPDGISVYDCIEFAPRFRCGDVAADLAFLAMDLDNRGYPGFSGYLVKSYADRSGDADLAQLMDFYKSYRAVVRAKVASLTAVDAGVDPDRREEERRSAMRYLQLAASYELPHGLVLMCGVPGAGKTYLAEHLAAPLRAAHLGGHVERHLHADRADAYRKLLDDAVAQLARGRTAIVDATFWTRAFRAPFLDAAARLSVPALIVHVTVPEDVARTRLERRAGDDEDRLRTDLDAFTRSMSAFERPTELVAADVVDHSSGAVLPEEAGAAIVDRWIERFEPALAFRWKRITPDTAPPRLRGAVPH